MRVRLASIFLTLMACGGGDNTPDAGNIDAAVADAAEMPAVDGAVDASDDATVDAKVPPVEVQCPASTTVVELKTGMNGTGTRPARFPSSCGTLSDPYEAVYRYVLDRPVEALRFEGYSNSQVLQLHVRYMSCVDAAAEVACALPNGAYTPRAVIHDPPLGVYYVFAEAGWREFNLQAITVKAEGQSCDFLLHDECQAGSRCVEGICAPAECRDGKDNDGDQKVDFPDDPGCASPVKVYESDDCPMSGCPACGDGKDNDGDGAIDYPRDPGCTSAADRDEQRGVCQVEHDEILPITGPVITGSNASATDDVSIEGEPLCYDREEPTSVPDRSYWVEFPGALNVLTLRQTAGRPVYLGISSTPWCSWFEACHDGEGDVVRDFSVHAGEEVRVVADGASDSYTLELRGEITGGEACDPAQIASGLARCEPGSRCVDRMCQW